MRARLYIAITAVAGTLVLGNSLLHWQSHDPIRFVCYLLIAAMAGTMKVRLPGIEGTMSVHFLMVLLGIMELSLPETLLIGCIAALVQTVWKLNQRPKPVRVIFNVLSMTVNAVWISYYAYHALAVHLKHSTPLLLVDVAVGKTH